MTALEEYLLGYQTYTQPGLPPTPIAAPRIGSIEAVANAPVDQGYSSSWPAARRHARRLALLRALEEHNANIACANEECAGQ